MYITCAAQSSPPTLGLAVHVVTFTSVAALDEPTCCEAKPFFGTRMSLEFVLLLVFVGNLVFHLAQVCQTHGLDLHHG